ncbi:BolA family transcriptional regulator [Wolbachia endosymbiont of Atemnus politus]|uniref:BolA family protein n=1 Tax=Wolbachia endosymbiont of Atemnus politus TaxID=2682840 RepID=UPI0015749434|nr:BolA family protein [Wolbachia endosymbiont of Atemnus politus]NSM56583.1 BolA family transcriptional regulator [Wolbachia endosymbiont of Atemnus politus]NSX83293.1 BolA/IbaG family iron-sulfur metabolism protein [Wolbachia endosymbiont of Atemnus politus]
MDIIKTIEEKIRSSIDVIDIDIIDESIKHADHYFAAYSTLLSHIKLILVSNSFIGMSALKRHKLIYELLKSEIEQVHAISLHLYTQSEYNSKNK